MEEHRKLSNEEYEKLFEEGRYDLPFTHEAHLRLAWIHIVRYGLVNAEKSIYEQFLSFAKSKNADAKFSKTITIASVKMVGHFIKRSRADDFWGFIEEFPQLKNEYKDLLASHYDTDIFNGEEGRNEYLEPKVPFG